MHGGPSASPPHTADRAVVALLAIGCGAAVANIYYAQPLLDTIAQDFGVSEGKAGLVATGTQVGYALGLLLLVPLGDLLERRKLVARVLVVTALALAATAAAPSVAVLGAALLVVGVTSVVAQILVPFAATLAGEEERGKVVGTVMSGLLIGILLARTVAGLVAELGGWRLVYGLAAAGMLLLAVVLRARLPEVRPPSSLSYGALLRSAGTLVREEPVLRRRMVYGTLGMAGFSVLWTSLAFELAGPDHGLSDGVIGLFGLVGLAGAGAAQPAGRGADAGHTRALTVGLLGATLLGWALMAFGTTSLLLLAVGIVLLDLGVQGNQIVSQSLIYALKPEARSRLTTAYMTAVFTGGAAGSAASAAAWSAGGWGAVSGLGAALAALALAVCAQEAWASRAAAKSSAVAASKA